MASAEYQERRRRMVEWEQRQRYARFHEKEVAGYNATAGQSQPWWKRAGDWLSKQGDKLAGSVSDISNALKVWHLKFTELESGHISVRAETPPGTRLEYRNTVAEIMASPDGFLNGTRYSPRTIAVRTAGGLLRRSVSKSNLVLAVPISLASNLWQFGTNPAEGANLWDRTVKNREFWVSTGVDIAVSLAVGVTAAAVVGTVVVGLGAAGIAVPLAIAILATTVVGWGIASLVEYFRLPDKAKNWVNGLLSGK